MTWSGGPWAVTGAARASGGLRGDPPDDQLTVVVGVAVHRLERLRALDVEVQIVLPGEPDTAVHLDRLAADTARGVADVRLGDRRREVVVLGLRVERPRGIVDGRVRVLDLQEHLGALVTDRLEGADRLPELLAHFRIADGHVEAPAGGAEHFCPPAPRPAAQEASQQRSRPVRLARDCRARPRRPLPRGAPPTGPGVHPLRRLAREPR